MNRRIPLLRFFLKQELIWVPIIGLCWWALDFPFMKRYSKAYLARHPEKKGQDLATTRKACAKFSRIPVAVFNFLEAPVSPAPSTTSSSRRSATCSSPRPAVSPSSSTPWASN